jgi:hypothetical protein
MLPLWFALLGGSFVFLNVGPMILFFVFALFWVLWFILCIPPFLGALIHLLLAGFHIIEQHKRQKNKMHKVHKNLVLPLKSLIIVLVMKIFKTRYNM